MTQRLNTDKVTTQLKTVWNNVRYNWNITDESQFKDETPIWLLGFMYMACRDADSKECHNLSDFMSKFTTLIWLTYRTDFTQPLPFSKLRSDSGWGCMLRTGQMLLAQAISVLELGRDWNLFAVQDCGRMQIHNKVLRLFLDSQNSAFSLHNLALEGKLSFQRDPGEWYGPALISHLLKKVVDKMVSNAYIELNLGVYVAQDCAVYTDEVLKMAGCGARLSEKSCGTRKAQKSHKNLYPSLDELHPGDSEPIPWSKPVLVLVPLRLGSEHINPVYIPSLKSALSLRYCVGVIGGKPKHSLYFVGWHENSLLYLDPHYCQDSIDGHSTFHIPLKTFHCSWPKLLPFEDMDPSCALGFLLRTEQDYQKFVKDVQSVLLPSSAVKFPLFSLIQSKKDAFRPAIPEMPSNSASASLANGLPSCLSDFEIL